MFYSSQLCRNYVFQMNNCTRDGSLGIVYFGISIYENNVMFASTHKQLSK